VVSKEEVLEALKQVLDPEIAFNIVDLGLIYDVQISGEETDGKASVSVKMTLTTPMCPAAPELIEQVKQKAGALTGVGKVDVEIVWEPAWTVDKMSDQAKIELGLI